ncbi:hypothetical protein [Arsenicicoccus dermatophilus]|uniref:hypothetical protein n=1 Tax=Arsenicicoccus dermatophilus TaxID=1076331 RepID=UPI00391741B2
MSATDPTVGLDPASAPAVVGLDPASAPAVVGLDPVVASVREADHLAELLAERLDALLGDPAQAAVVSTHPVRGPVPHVALGVRLDPPIGMLLPDLLDALAETLLPHCGAEGAGEIGVACGPHRRGLAALASWAAAVEEESRRGMGGRAVVYPGRAALVGTLAVRDLVRLSAIDEVVGLAGSAVGSQDQVRTRDFVRPVWRDGRLLLPVQPADGGMLVPYETPSPTPCCADH